MDIKTIKLMTKFLTEVKLLEIMYLVQQSAVRQVGRQARLLERLVQQVALAQLQRQQVQELKLQQAGLEQKPQQHGLQ